jgi:hypothetical protein
MWSTHKTESLMPGRYSASDTIRHIQIKSNHLNGRFHMQGRWGGGGGGEGLRLHRAYSIFDCFEGNTTSSTTMNTTSTNNNPFLTLKEKLISKILWL